MQVHKAAVSITRVSDAIQRNLGNSGTARSCVKPKVSRLVVSSFSSSSAMVFVKRGAHLFH